MSRSFNVPLLLLAIGGVLWAATRARASDTGEANTRRERGIASWYGPGFAGKKTANGEVFDPAAMTAAHKSIRFGTEVTVRLVDDPTRSVVVRVNDRGPFVEGRIIDLSQAAADRLGILRRGIAEVEISYSTEG